MADAPAVKASEPDASAAPRVCEPVAPTRPEGLPALGIAALLLAAAQAPLGSTQISIALPSIASSLGLDIEVTTHWLVTSYLIVSIVGQSPGGRLGDALGYLWAVRAGMLLQAAGACIGLVAAQLPWLVLARSCIALGGAFVIPASVALLREHGAVERRGRLFGWLSATLSLSAALGPPLGGELLALFGWRAIFGAALALWCASTLAFRMTTWPAPTKRARTSLATFAREFDGIGTLLITAALGALLLGSRAHAARALIGFCTFACAFVVWELRHPQPIFDPRLFRSRGFGAGTSMIALLNFALYGLLFQLPNYFEHLRGATPKALGQVLFGMMLAMFAASAAGGRLCDRVGPRSSALCALVPLLAGSLWLQRLPTFTTPPAALGALVLLGTGTGLLNAPCQTAAMSAIASARAGVAAGASSTMRYLGGVLSIFMLRIVLDVPAGQSALAAHAAVARGFLISSLIVAALCVRLPARAAE